MTVARLAIGALAGLLLLGAAGFGVFLGRVAATPPLPAEADGIVALTGGPGRVEAALQLLAEGRARIALVSGVGGAAAFEELARRAGVDPVLAPRVTLGRAAQSTRGNAVETASWVRANALRSLIVVTAAYHMPRALAELARALPGVRLHPAPVAGGASWRLLVEEYGKWIAVELGLSAWETRGMRTEGPVAISALAEPRRCRPYASLNVEDRAWSGRRTIGGKERPGSISGT